MTNAFAALSHLGSSPVAVATSAITDGDDSQTAATVPFLKPTYEVLFDGRQHSILIVVAVPKEPYAKMMFVKDIGDYVQFGRIADRVEGKDVYFNTYLRGETNDVLKRLIGKKVIGHPVLMKKTMSDGRSFVNLDVLVESSQKTHPTHTLVIRSKGLTDQWCLGNHNRPLGPRDHIFDLAAPLPSNVGFIKL